MSENNQKRKCPKCGSDNISYQRETTGTIGGSRHTISSGHGCLYMALIGWWIWIFKLMWEMIKFGCTCGLSLFFRKKKATGRTISLSKNINRTVAVCQNCGNTWKLK